MSKEMVVKDMATELAEAKAKDSRIDTSEVLEGIELKKNKLGKFESPMVDGLSFSEKEIIIVGGQLSYTLWGDEKLNPEHKAMFFFEADNKKDALELFKQVDEAHGLTDSGYTFQKQVGEGYTLFFLDAETKAPFFIKMSKSGKKEFLNYAQSIKYKLVGNTNMALSEVVTKLSVQEMKGGSFRWLAEKFEFVKDVK